MIHSIRKLPVAFKSNIGYAEKYVKTHSQTIVAVGKLFGDEFLQPGETVEQKIVFHIPDEEYDLLEVFSIIPSVSDPEIIELEWKLNDKAISPKPIIYSIETHCVWWTVCIRKSQGERKLVKMDESGILDTDNIEYQVTSATVGLSLWH